MSRTRFALALAASLGALSSAVAPAAAAPMIDRGVATAADLDQIRPEAVRYVCDAWGRCWWRPNVYRPYGFYGPRRFYGPRVYGPRRFYGGGWGHRGWRRW